MYLDRPLVFLALLFLTGSNKGHLPDPVDRVAVALSIYLIVVEYMDYNLQGKRSWNSRGRRRSQSGDSDGL